MSTLELGVIGNGSFSALVDARARVVWCCLPRFDSDPIFNLLLNNGEADPEGDPHGVFEIAVDDLVRSEQTYVGNTAVLETLIQDAHGNALRIVDFAPRFFMRGRMFHPLTLVRRIEPVQGRPRIAIRMRPSFDYGAMQPSITYGSNHVRYVHSGQTLRLNTNAPINYVLNETPFLLEERINLILGPDETLASGIEETARDFETRTIDYWKTWVRRLALPLEWQDAVIRAAITLKLCAFEETGAIIAAMTTSIPEAADSGRNWDYRFCWLRDSFFVIRALNSLAEVETMENYLRYISNVIARAEDGHLQPVYGIALEQQLVERSIDSLAGYRGMGPVRAGNQAYEHLQHDVYGNVILGASQAFFDRRIFSQPGIGDFERLEEVGNQAYRLHDQPDASMWEFRTKSRVHTSSSLMCWAACDRLAKIAAHLGLIDRAGVWQTRAEEVRDTILERAWNPERGIFADSFGGDGLDAGVLLMAEVGFIEPSDPRFVSTVEAMGAGLLRDKHLYRYATADDFGKPETAFNVCTFWYIDALIRIGRVDEAREIFEETLACRNALGLLSEDVDPATRELWGNYPQTYSLVGIINAAMRLSRKWEEEI